MFWGMGFLNYITYMQKGSFFSQGNVAKPLPKQDTRMRNQMANTMETALETGDM